MALPLQIRITDHEARLTAAGVPYGISMVAALEFAFLVDVDGETIVMSPYEFACKSAVCAPPNKKGTGGTGGSLPKAGGGSAPKGGIEKDGTAYAPKKGFIGSAEHAHDMKVVAGKGDPGHQREDGILTESFLDDEGNVVLTAKEEKAAHDRLKEMGTSYEELVQNGMQVALNSMNNDQDVALHDALWYQHEHDVWGVPLAAEHGLSVAQVMGIASVTSTNKTWDHVTSSNKETVENILQIIRSDMKITITAEQAKSYAAFSVKKDGSRRTAGGGRYGPATIEPGEYRVSELSSGTLGRVLGAGYKIGGQYRTDGLVKAFAIARGELPVNIGIPSLKQRSFVNNLTHPDIDYSSTNDFWMVRGLLGNKPLTLIPGREKMTVREWEAETGEKPNGFIGTRGTGTHSLFAIMTKASKEARRRLAETDPRFRMDTQGFQALSWVQMQREYLAAGLPIDGGE